MYDTEGGMNMNPEGVEGFAIGIANGIESLVSGLPIIQEGFESTFNELWVSDRAKTLVNEINTCVNNSLEQVGGVLNEKDADLRHQVDVFNQNQQHEHPLNYPGYNFEYQPLSVTLNENGRRNDGYIGPKTDISLTEIQKPMNSLNDAMCDFLNQMANVAENEKPYQPEWNEPLVNDLKSIANNLNNEMTKLSDSLLERLNGEDGIRVDLNTFIITSNGGN